MGIKSKDEGIERYQDMTRNMILDDLVDELEEERKAYKHGTYGHDMLTGIIYRLSRKQLEIIYDRIKTLEKDNDRENIS